MKTKPTTTKPAPKLGDRRWKLEWCKELPCNECGDADFDRAVYVDEFYPNEAAAVARAKHLIRERMDRFGDVVVTQQEVEVDQDILACEGRRKLAWATVGEPEHIWDDA